MSGKNTNNFRVFIPTAGIGSRMSPLTDTLNKCLLSIDNKPLIAHIIDKFSVETEFVIALGYKGNLVKEFLKITYPERIFHFVEIDDYTSPESGLGLTIWRCREYLQCPFIFISNDLFVTDNFNEISLVNEEKNWIGFSGKRASNLYRSILISNNNLTLKIFEKNIKPDLPAYIGLCKIKDFEIFWNYMSEGIQNKDAILQGECYAINKMIEETSFFTLNFNWFDAGDLKSYENIKNTFTTNNYNILDKKDESIWFIKNKVIKYHNKKDFIKNRATRASIIDGFCPKIISKTDHMYCYNMVPGEIFSKKININNFKKLLLYLDNFWEEKRLDKEEEKKFKDKCLNFYKEKTFSRANEYFKRFFIHDSSTIINGIKIGLLSDLLNKIDWDVLSDGFPCRFHGDLHFENIIITENDNFTLIDWRQDFDGLIEYGDIYYDLAKINHGIIVSHENINKNLYSFDINNNQINFNFAINFLNLECQKIFYEHIEKLNLNTKKVKILTALIYLNIAVLHHEPYCHMLFYLGKYLLHKEINGVKND